MSSSNDTTSNSSPLEINTSEEILRNSATKPESVAEASEHETEHEPDTPTSSSSSSTNSFTTVMMSSSTILTDPNDPHETPTPSSSSASTSTVRAPSSAEQLEGSSSTTSNGSLAPPAPPRTIKKKTKSSTPSTPPEWQGWDDSTPMDGNVLDHQSQKEVSRRITHTEKLITHSMRVAYGGSWSFTKVFADATFIASGYLSIPPGGRKSSKSVKDNTYIFHVLEGAVNVKIHETAYILAPGGSFMVPRGNVYAIENICDKTAKLMFVQGRELTAGEQDDPLRLERGQLPPRILPALQKSKLLILLGWVIERFLKRFVKYRKVALTWYLRTAMEVGRYVKGPRAYAAFFVLGFLFRSLGPSRSLLPRVNVQVIRD